MAKKIVISLIVVILLLAGGFVLYGMNAMEAVGVEDSLASDDTVEVSKIDEGWLFDGSGTDTAYVFYPGARVEAEAYAPLMHRLASQGIDCFLLEMPINFAILDTDAAEEIIEEYDYDSWYIGGHSMGGAAAAMFAADDTEEIEAEGVEGLILLAAYESEDMSDADMRTLVIYGSEDGVLNMEKLAEGRSLVPADGYEEVCIEGGNHAQFGSYGEQSGDGEAKISADEQLAQTTEAILRFAAT